MIDTQAGSIYVVVDRLLKGRLFMHQGLTRFYCSSQNWDEYHIKMLNPTDHYQLTEDKAHRILEQYGGIKSLHEAIAILSKGGIPRQQAWNPGSFHHLVGMRADTNGQTTHGLLFQGTDYLPNITEPQVTKALATALDAPIDPEHRRSRVQAFLTALGTPEEVRNNLFCEVDASFPKINAEQSTRIHADGRMDNRRKQGSLDLVFSGPSRDGITTLIIIEAKFGHQVTDGQLDNYTKWVKWNTGNETLVDQVILSIHGGKRIRNRKNGWRNVSWFSLMRRWEEQSDEDCASLRLIKSIIWEKQKV